MIIKRKLLFIFGLALLLILSGCGGSGTSEKKEEARSDVATLNVKSGEFITMDGQENSDESALLALQISITNNSDKSLDLLSDDLSLYDSNDEKVSVDEAIYGAPDNFKMLNTDALAKGKTVTGYIPFRVSKNKTYELHFQPNVYDGGKQVEEIVVKINTKKFADHSGEAKDALNAYVQTVFFAKDDSKYPTLVANDSAKEKQRLKELFIKNMGTTLDDQLSDQQKNQIYNDFIAANREKGSVALKIDTAIPNSAIIEVTPNVLNLNDMYDEVQDLKDQFIDDNRGKYSDYNAAMKGWYAYIAKNLGEVFKNNEPRTSDSSYKINLKKQGEKWEIDSEKRSDNYDYEDLLTEMTGGY